LEHDFYRPNGRLVAEPALKGTGVKLSKHSHF